MNITKSKRNKSFKHRFRKFFSELGLFFILLVLPAFTIWVAFSNIQNNLQQKSQEENLEEMAEITAHLLRLSEPESYYQEAVRKLSESFKWAENINDVPRISNKENLELSLFDSEGNRQPWPANEPITKKSLSENYLSYLIRFSKNQEAKLENQEKSFASSYSGNVMTVKSLADNPNTLINFQGIGLPKMGGWFKIKFANKTPDNKTKEGYLIAWLNLNKLERYTLADQALQTLAKRTNPKFTFSFIDLNNPSVNRSSDGKVLKKDIIKILTSNSLKSGFIFQNTLFSINDTQDGIRLICSRNNPAPLPILKNYNRLLLVFIPTMVLFFFWKKLFKVTFNLSVKYQSLLIFGFAAIIGITTMLISTFAYQYEKQITIAQNYKNKSIEILEKVDQQYFDSYSDIIVQYKHFIENLRQENSKPDIILSPLLKAQKEGIISYAVYINSEGEIVFQAPTQISNIKSNSIADKYSRLVCRTAKECLKSFNSTRNKIEITANTKSLRAMISNAVDGLLNNRSTFIETKLDNDEVVAFMDLPLDNKDYAKGCLIIVHEPQKLEKRYLYETGKNLASKTGFELIAFPKKVSNQNSYFPKFSYTNEEPLWKLNDMLNQTQLPSFKEGKIQNENYVVAAIPGSNMKNYNLFLAMPDDEIYSIPFSLSNIIMIGLALSLILIVSLSIILINSITSPVKILTENAISIQEDSTKQQNQIVFSDSTELESISTGLTNLVVKVKEFEEERYSCEKLFTPEPYQNPDYAISNFLSQSTYDNKSLCYISQPEKNTVFIFLARIDDASNLNASLPLTMCAMAMELYTRQLNLHTPIGCLKNLEEYFRINLRRKLSGSAFVAFLDTNTNTLSYSGFGKIRLLKYDQENKNYNIIKLPNGEGFIKEVKEQGNITCELSSGESFIAITEPIAETKIEALRQRLENQNSEDKEFETNLIKNVKELTKSESYSCNVAFIHRNKSDDSKQLLQKLAENNPIALIRSQKARSQTSV